VDFVCVEFYRFVWEVPLELVVDSLEEVMTDWRIFVSFEKFKVGGDADYQRSLATA
jgi:hypothetical protein